MAGRPRRRARLGIEPHPLCGFTLRDGTTCTQSSEDPEGGPCAGHRAAADATATAPLDDVADEKPAAVKQSGSPRARLREDVAGAYELVRDAVLDGLSAGRAQPVACPSCKQRFSVTVPDHGARLKAVDLALEQGFGRPPLEESKPGTQAQHWASVKDPELEDATDEELRVMVDLGRQFADILADAELKLRPQFREFLVDNYEVRWHYEDNLRKIAMHERNERLRNGRAA